jgi:hypothetical protein
MLTKSRKGDQLENPTLTPRSSVSVVGASKRGHHAGGELVLISHRERSMGHAIMLYLTNSSSFILPAEWNQAKVLMKADR